MNKVKLNSIPSTKCEYQVFNKYKKYKDKYLYKYCSKQAGRTIILSKTNHPHSG